MSDFLDIFNGFDNKFFYKTVANDDKEKVRRVLEKDGIDFNDFLLLISDGARDLLPEISEKARSITIKRFGRVINFYAPVYLSNECTNSCTYCGFNCKRNVDRVTLGMPEIENEFMFLKDQGFDSILLLTGESPVKAGADYIGEAVKLAKRYFTYVGLEVFPMTVQEYAGLVEAGASGLTIYQETYDTALYDTVHPGGRKKDFKWRLDAPGRAFQAGFRKVGLGSLLGLNDWRYEAALLGLHALYLRKKFWKGEVTMSFPRINPVETGFGMPYPVSDRDMVWMISAMRMLLPESGFLLSTREKPEFREKLIDLCITQISAGSRTNPGGYTGGMYEQQFEVADRRSLNEMIDLLISKGYDPVLKDWENCFFGIK
jgi:2-iminoacetate synthase